VSVSPFALSFAQSTSCILLPSNSVKAPLVMLITDVTSKHFDGILVNWNLPLASIFHFVCASGDVLQYQSWISLCSGASRQRVVFPAHWMAPSTPTGGTIHLNSRSCVTLAPLRSLQFQSCTIAPARSPQTSKHNSVLACHRMCTAWGSLTPPVPVAVVVAVVVVVLQVPLEQLHHLRHFQHEPAMLLMHRLALLCLHQLCYHLLALIPFLCLYQPFLFFYFFGI